MNDAHCPPSSCGSLRDFAASRETNSLQSYPTLQLLQYRSRAGKPELLRFVNIRVHSWFKHHSPRLSVRPTATTRTRRLPSAARLITSSGKNNTAAGRAWGWSFYPSPPTPLPFQGRGERCAISFPTKTQNPPLAPAGGEGSGVRGRWHPCHREQLRESRKQTQNNTTDQPSLTL